MPFQFQLQDAINSIPLKNISGTCSNSAQFLSYMNEATRRLLKRGDWYGSEQVVEFCTNGCSITWPHWVGTILGVRFGESRSGHVFNNWYRFVGSRHHHGGFRSDTVLEDAGASPCYNDIVDNTGKLIRYNVVQPTDIGKTITIYGTQYGGQPLREQDANGIWSPGMTITAANPYGTSPVLVTKIDSITRQPTDGMGYLYQYDPVTQVVIDMARFEPNETNPRYRRSCMINAHHSNCKVDANGIKWRKVEAIIKLGYVPLVNNRDFLLIDDFDALKFMIQAIRSEEKEDNNAAEAFILKAIRELNFRDRDKQPDETTPVRVTATQGHTIRNPW